MVTSMEREECAISKSVRCSAMKSKFQLRMNERNSKGCCHPI